MLGVSILHGKLRGPGAYIVSVMIFTGGLWLLAISFEIGHASLGSFGWTFLLYAFFMLFLGVYLTIQSLVQISGYPQLKGIPIVVLTTSESEQGLIKYYALRANGHITKPVDLDHFIAIVQSIKYIWRSIRKLPEGS
jgi:hypothetical protein